MVLKTRVFGEADRVIGLLTRSHGYLECLAKGVRRSRSKFGARVEPFMHVHVQLHKGRTFHYVSQSETVAAYAGPIAANYDAYTAAMAIAETSHRLSVSDADTTAALYRQTLGALAALARKAHPPGTIVDAFLIRAVALAGWSVTVTDCAICGAPGPHPAFAVKNGGSVCASCRGPGAMSVKPAVLEHMVALMTADWETVHTSSAATCRAASSLITGYTQWHLETHVRSLAMVGDNPEAALARWADQEAATQQLLGTTTATPLASATELHAAQPGTADATATHHDPSDGYAAAAQTGLAPVGHAPGGSASPPCSASPEARPVQDPAVAPDSLVLPDSTWETGPPAPIVQHHDDLAVAVTTSPATHTSHPTDGGPAAQPEDQAPGERTIKPGGDTAANPVAPA